MKLPGTVYRIFRACFYFHSQKFSPKTYLVDIPLAPPIMYPQEAEFIDLHFQKTYLNTTRAQTYPDLDVTNENDIKLICFMVGGGQDIDIMTI